MDLDTTCRAFSLLIKQDDELLPPFLWQRRLITYLRDGHCPDVVDVPTGCGKTAVMAIWLIAKLTSRHECSALPRRLVYVVDRRAVVDQATRFAQVLKNNLTLDNELQSMVGFNGHELAVSTLRGSYADNKQWLEDPSRIAIIVGTVDMIGSRLLFEGYGVSPKMRSYHAALLGVDSLFVLDEAHLCPSFESTLRTISTKRDALFGPKDCVSSNIHTPPFKLMSLSATVRRRKQPTESSPLPFVLDSNDINDKLVNQRLNATKLLRFIEQSSRNDLADLMAERVYELNKGNCASKILVFCNSRNVATKTLDAISKSFKNFSSQSKLHIELCVGERRYFERSKLEEWLEKRGFLNSKREIDDEPSVLVATSAGEVGVDLDADHMVCDLVSWERMVQRLGRVNRRGGNNRKAFIEVIKHEPYPEKKTDPKKKTDQYKILNDRIAACKELLELLPRTDDNFGSASPQSLRELTEKHSDLVERASTPPQLCPPLSRPVLESWSLTSLKDHPGRPEVEPWLRGWDVDEEATTTVVWRNYLPVMNTDHNDPTINRSVELFFEYTPIHISEKLEALASHVFEWLKKLASRVAKHANKNDNDRDSKISAVVLDSKGSLLGLVFYEDLVLLGTTDSLLNAHEQNKKKTLNRDLQSHIRNSTLIISAKLGGLSESGMLDHGCNTEAKSADLDTEWIGECVDEVEPLIKFRVKKVHLESDGLDSTSAFSDKGWLHVGTFPFSDDPDESEKVLKIFKWRNEPIDEEARSVQMRELSLAQHSEDVRQKATDLSKALDLDEQEARAIIVAAYAHDQGKEAKWWQDAMGAPDDGRPYAKTRGGGNLHLLGGYRHEFGSLVHADSRDDLDPEYRDLILHLIASHHGYARPIIGFQNCENIPPSRAEKLAGQAALRFFELQDQYGVWGLAYREVILRAADQIASREADLQIST